MRRLFKGFYSEEIYISEADEVERDIDLNVNNSNGVGVEVIVPVENILEITDFIIRKYS